jgi:phosphoglycolate phosphatase
MINKSPLSNINTILWDWNGTLLNDTDHCIECINHLLKKRGLELLHKERYLNIFTFPVMNYYNSLGFDFSKERFEVPAEEFIVHYKATLNEVKLYTDAVAALKYFQERGLRQYILSAMQQDALIDSVKVRNIAQYFIKISGIEDNLANGKTALAHKLLESENIDPQTTLMIGDTLHDAEVADAIGIKCVLISHGHQHHNRLRESGKSVFTSLDEFMHYHKWAH